MEVILLEPVKNLGVTGNLVRVKDGYARNFLIPTNKALRATETNIAYYESKKAEIQKADDAKRADAEKLKKKMDGVFITLIRQAGEDGRLYGSVNAADIATGLSEKEKHEIKRTQVVLNAPIKYIGVHVIEVTLHGDVSAEIHANVARSAEDAKEAERRTLAGERVMEGGIQAQASANPEPAEVTEELNTGKVSADQSEEGAAGA